MPGELSLRPLVDAAFRAYFKARPLPPPPETVERVPAPTLQEFETKYRHPARPVIFQGITDDWPAHRNWRLPELKKRFGDRLVPMIPTNDGRGEHSGKNGIPFNQIRFDEFIKRLEQGGHPGCYMVSPIDRALPELRDDVVEPIYSRHRPFRASRFWFSAPGTSLPLHRDILQNFVVQMVGRKRFSLYRPEDSPWLYSYPFLSAEPNFSQFEPEHPDYERFPLARQVTPIEVVLEPGDCLYLPSLWWHQPKSLEISMSYNFWWADGLLEKVVRLADVVRKFNGWEIYRLDS